ncbi:MAG: 2Fe-2S iron-sulfur cluster binding domain-containing protein [Deltaproteobacteria bacterium]|nr:2Fe-2S iron-sulfur cluster binding domain-containing protein [Deltaproteobacteria bacterium]
MAIVKFLPLGREVEVEPGENLYRAAQAAGVPMGSSCAGIGSCTGCRVRIVEGEQHLSAMGYKERERLGNTYFITKERLACQTLTSGPLVVEVLQEQQRDKRERARRRALDRTLEDAHRRAQRQNGQGGPATAPPLQQQQVVDEVAAPAPDHAQPRSPASVQQPCTPSPAPSPLASPAQDRLDPAHRQGETGGRSRSARRRRARATLAAGQQGRAGEAPLHLAPHGARTAPAEKPPRAAAAGDGQAAATATSDEAGAEQQRKRRRRRGGRGRHGST